MLSQYIYILTTHFYTYNPTIHRLNQDMFSFKKDRLGDRDHKDRQGWYYQQALKLIAPLEIKHLLCPNVLILDADLYFLRNFYAKPAVEEQHNDQNQTSKQQRWNYFFPSHMPASYLVNLAGSAQKATYEILHLPSVNLFGTLCTVHHHMLFQLDVLEAMHRHVESISMAMDNSSVDNNTPMLSTESTTNDASQKPKSIGDYIVSLQSRRRWFSVFDLYFTYAWHYYHDRMSIIEFPYLHSRDSERCTPKDIEAIRSEGTDIVMIACSDTWAGKPDVGGLLLFWYCLHCLRV